MQKTDLEQLTMIKNYLRKSSNDEGKTVEQIRQDMAETAAALPQIPHITVTKVAVGHLKGEWVNTEDKTRDSETSDSLLSRWRIYRRKLRNIS